MVGLLAVGASQFLPATNPVRAAGLGPAVDSYSPQAGPVGGGSWVVINGAGFQAQDVVKFGTDAAPYSRVDSDSKIVAVSPPHAAGYARVSVTDPGSALPSVTTEFRQGSFFYQSAGTAPPKPVLRTLEPAFGLAGTAV
ncbi:MAG: IPT/TIG domain-containing protein, partial [Candidatus Dormibacteria bacterium]